MKPEEQDAINRAKNSRSNGNVNGSKPGNENEPVNKQKAVNTKSGAQRLQEKLAPGIEAVAQLTEQSLLSGIPIGIQRFSSGEFSPEAEQMFNFVTDFAGSLSQLAQNARFQLASADDDEETPKKMLPGSSTVDAVTVS